MINETKAARITAGVDAGSVLPGLSNYSEADLYKLRAEIDALLPQQSLSAMNLESELVTQFHTVKRLQTLILDDDETPANQRAQVANAVVGTLDALVKMQERYHNSERFKAIENLLIKHMRTMPREIAEKFIADYEALNV